MITLVRRIAWTAAGLVALAAVAAAQTAPPAQDPASAAQTPAGRRGGGLPPRGAAVPPGALTTEEVYSLLDAFVMTRAQTALQLTDTQFAAFFQPMTRLQALQRQHRRHRQRILNELRRVVGPNPPEGTDEAAIAAKTKELDDLEAQIALDERRALGEIDQVLPVVQRARLRVFLETMERQKLDLLLKARQGRGAPIAPPPGAVR